MSADCLYRDNVLPLYVLHDANKIATDSAQRLRRGIEYWKDTNKYNASYFVKRALAYGNRIENGEAFSPVFRDDLIDKMLNELLRAKWHREYGNEV